MTPLATRMDSLALHLRRPLPLHPRSGPSNFLCAGLSPSSSLRCSSVVTPPTPTSARCVRAAEVTDYRLSHLRCSGLTPRQGESRGHGGSITSSSFAKDIFTSSSTATFKLLRYVRHQFQRVAHLAPDPAVIISHPLVVSTSTHGGCHHLRGRPSTSARQYRARVLHPFRLPSDYVFTISIHGGFRHGGYMGRRTGPYRDRQLFSEEAHVGWSAIACFFLDCILR